MCVTGPRPADDLEEEVSDLTRFGDQAVATAGDGPGNELFVREDERRLLEHSDW